MCIVGHRARTITASPVLLPRAPPRHPKGPLVSGERWLVQVVGWFPPLASLMWLPLHLGPWSVIPETLLPPTKGPRSSHFLLPPASPLAAWHSEAASVPGCPCVRVEFQTGC